MTKKALSTEDLTDLLLKETAKTGGASIGLYGDKARHGIMIAVSKDVENIVPAGLDWQLATYAYIKTHREGLKHYHYFGAWVNEDGALVLDVSECFPDVRLTEAIEAAKEREQDAIYHVPTGTVLTLS